MMTTELEAAEALVGLAELSRESWGNKGKRAGKRVKSESPPADSGLNPVGDSVSKSSDLTFTLTQDQARCKQQEGGAHNGNALVKLEIKNVELRNSVPVCGNNNLSLGGGRSRNNLTEAEKEARRMRRILANRESARQTIRRRQALCEDLTRKAADLARENDKLKKEKELALEEYRSLEITNKQLKEQMNNASKVQVKEASVLLNLVHSNASAPSSTNCQSILYNPYPLMPLCWPPVIQSSDPKQLRHQPQNPTAMPSNMPLGTSSRLNNSPEQESSVSLNVPKPSFYMFPLPWFFPFPGGNGFQHPSINPQKIPDKASVANQCGASSSPKNITDVNDSSEVKVKAEAARLTATDLNESLVEFSSDGGAQCVGPRPKEMLNAPMLLDSVGTKFMAEHEHGFKSDRAMNTGIKPTTSPSVNVPVERNQESLSHSSKKLVDAVVAAEARRRRKELTKLKNSNGRQVRMKL